MINGRFAELEQFVNSRKRVIGNPSVSYEYTPEFGEAHDLIWLLIPIEKLKFFSNLPEQMEEMYKGEFTVGEGAEKKGLFPIHWFEEHNYENLSKIRMGKGKTSSSYRTVFLYFDDNETRFLEFRKSGSYMMKLHLSGEIPGVPGDRRITKEVAVRCLRKSKLLESLKDNGYFPSYFDFMREDFCLLYDNRGAIFRKIPDYDMIPAFSLFSKNIRKPFETIAAISIFEKARMGNKHLSNGNLFINLFVEKPLEVMIAGFSCGLSMEMHPQNFLMKFSEEGTPEKVIVRDMEGILLFESGKYRKEIKNLVGGDDIIYEGQVGGRIGKYFNRNIDFDLTRFIENLLEIFAERRYLSKNEVKSVYMEIKKRFHEIAEKYHFDVGILTPSFLGFSASPYGRWYNRSNYFRIKYR